MKEEWMLERLNSMDNWEGMKRFACYEVWGFDKLSQERYPCGVYAHRTSANRRRRQLETQSNGDGGMADEYWVKQTTWMQHLSGYDAGMKKKWYTKELIKWHQEYLKEEMPRFADFVRSCPREPGCYEFPMQRQGSYIKCLAVNICQRHRSRKYDFTIGICFSEDWESARFSACHTAMKAETMEQIKQLELTGTLFEGFLDEWQRQIMKFFSGEY